MRLFSRLGQGELKNAKETASVSIGTGPKPLTALSFLPVRLEFSPWVARIQNCASSCRCRPTSPHLVPFQTERGKSMLTAYTLQEICLIGTNTSTMLGFRKLAWAPASVGGGR
jgi:hypothetical protein